MAKATEKLGKFITVRKDGKGDFKSIQAAIDAALPNSLIEVGDSGVYDGRIRVKDDLSIRAAKEQWPIITYTGPKRRCFEFR